MTTENNNTLNNMQENAREFWRLAGSHFAPHYYVYSQLLAYQATYGEADFAEYQSKVTQLLNGIGYGTDMDTISEQYSAGLDSELGYWSGTYHLFDTAGKCYKLTVSQDEALLMLPTNAFDVGQVKSPEDYTKLAQIKSADYQKGVLKLSNQQYAFEVRFSLPYSEKKLDDDSTDANFFAQATQPICQGKVIITENKASKTLEIAGQRGSYTQKGVQHPADGDPIDTWVGRYMVYEITEEGKFQQAADLLEITHDGENINLQWGKDIVGYDIQFNNNTLSAVDDSDPVNQYMMQFTCLQDGRQQFTMAVAQEGFTTELEHKFMGYWFDNPAVITKASALVHSAASLVTSSSKLTVGAEELPVQEVDISLGSIISTDFPTGVPGNPYRLSIKLSNIPKDADDQEIQYTWSMTSTRGTITANSTPSSAVLHLEWASADVNNKQTVTIELTPQTGTDEEIQANKKTLTLSIPVQNLTAISISPTTVPAIFRGNSYTIPFSANGGTGLFTWKAETLPPGFTFDAEKQLLEGSIGDIADSLDTFAFQVKVTANNAIMNPGRFTVPLQVQEPPQLAAQEISYAILALGIIGSLFAVIALPKKFYDDFKSVQKNRGDPTFEKGYKRGKLIGDSLKISLDALGGKRFNHHIEAAIQFDSKYAEWQKNNQKEPAIKQYSDLIDKLNKSLNSSQKEIAKLEKLIAEEKMSGKPNQANIDAYEDSIALEKAQENAEKAKFADDLTKLSEGIAKDYRDAQAARDTEKKDSWREKASKYIFGE